MARDPKSFCSINLALEVFGDKWTLLIIRDIMLGDKRHFREILQSEEKISTNILTDRLNMLESRGILTKGNDPSHKQKFVYSLTQKGIDLLPVIAAMAQWSLKHEPVSAISQQHTQPIAEGGPELIGRLSDELATKHL
ncbi:MAG TPA: transcriptional regulator [Cytophagales bacterium]|nr:transcriptional regulator [Cytophagales bacterium]HAA19322.1 transcriptional regulator [Cytophagales bacterium]HAP61289.1 transcriptional regulator [Cytophagales bacterium]